MHRMGLVLFFWPRRGTSAASTPNTGILGLETGTAARTLHHFWPEIGIHVWETDTALTNLARQFFDSLVLEEG